MRKFLTPLLLLVGLLLAACETTGNTPPTTESYAVSGTVLDADNNPIPGVEISFSGSTLITRTDADGAWQSPELTGSVTVTPSLAGYVFTPVNQEVHEAADDVNFTGVPTYTFTVVITDEDADPIPGVSLTVELEDGRELRGVETDRDGRWELEGVVGAVTVTPTDPAYTFHYEEDTATADRTELSFEGEMHRCNRVTTRDGADWCVITRIKQLQDAQLDGHYELGADIDASATREWNEGKGFLPIGDGEYVSGDYPGAFTGKLDGAGKAITGLFIARPGEENVGLFAVLGKGSEVRELSLSGVDVTGGSAVGALAGRLFGSVHNTVVEGVEVDGRVRGEGVAGSEVGGLVGTAHESIITRSSSAAEVEGSDSVGGLVGRSIRDTIRDSHASGRVGGFNDVGGLVGRTQGQGYTIIERSYSAADVYSRPGASGSSQNVGGLVGSNYSGTILQSFSHGQVQGEAYVGGLVGRNSHTIENSYSLSSVSGEYAVGGLVGESTSNDDEHRYVENTYSAGAVKATSDAEWVGGLIGRASEGHALNSSYWDVDASGVNTDGTSNAEALTTAQMSDPTNFVDWDFSTIWTMADDGYPELVNNSRDR